MNPGLASPGIGERLIPRRRYGLQYWREERAWSRSGDFPPMVERYYRHPAIERRDRGRMEGLGYRMTRESHIIVGRSKSDVTKTRSTTCMLFSRPDQELDEG